MERVRKVYKGQGRATEGVDKYIERVLKDAIGTQKHIEGSQKGQCSGTEWCTMGVEGAW